MSGKEDLGWAFGFFGVVGSEEVERDEVEGVRWAGRAGTANVPGISCALDVATVAAGTGALLTVVMGCETNVNGSKGVGVSVPNESAMERAK